MLLYKIMKRLTILQDLSSSIINNFFYFPQNPIRSNVKIFKEEILTLNDDAIKHLYIKSKRILNILNNFGKLYKWKKSVFYSIDTDLTFSPLKDFKDNQKITILENNTRYIFRLSDLINYWIVCLTDSQALFSRPVIIKNPHTNLDLSHHNLYNIYFKILDSPFNIPFYINAFFNCDMNIEQFFYKFFTLLKENTIETFTKSENVYEKFEQILNMLHDYRKDVDYITIAIAIPYSTKELLCKKFKKILASYLKSKYSCNPLIKKDEQFRTRRKLKKYIEKKPYFGLHLGLEVIRYVPRDERPRPTRIPISLPPALPSIPPPPPPLPPPLPLEQTFSPQENRIITSIREVVENVISPPMPEDNISSESNNRNVIVRNTTNIYSLMNPFAPSRELRRTPPSALLNSRRRQMSSNLRLFG